MASDNGKTFFVTTPIYYVSAEPHIGSAYPTLFADILTRFHKLNGYDVKFLTGTDEHGQKVQQYAEKDGKAPQDFVDNLSVKFRKILSTLDLHPTTFAHLDGDNFIRTTMSCHILFVQEVWKKLVKNGWIYKDKYEGWYCVSDEAYYTEDELVACENKLFKTKLGASVDWKVEESYFFRLGEFQEMLLNLYKKFPNLIKPEGKKTEVISFVSGLTIKDYEAGKPILKKNLKDLSISRNSFDWGINIPCDENGKELLDEEGNWKQDTKDKDKHIVYVWLDALFNYLTALGCGIKDDYNIYWLNNTKKYQLVGKDILRFHAVYWPALLLAFNYTREEIKNFDYDKLDEVKKYIPTTIFAHGWLTNEGQKISKSLGNGIYPEVEIKWIQNTYNIKIEKAVDYFKYYMINVVPFGNDGDYSRIKLVEKINSDLANKIGNLSKRVLDLIYKNFNKQIPNVKDFDNIANFTIIDFQRYIDSLDFISYIDSVLKIAEDTNKYIEDNEPWNLRKQNKIEKEAKVLYSAANSIYKIAILLEPIVPYLSLYLLNGLGYKEQLDFTYFSKKIEQNEIPEPEIIIPRMIVR
jgi:methionyl-tRNA synthetase